MTRLALAGLLAVGMVACYGPDPNLTESGKGRPYVEVSFPPTAGPGSVQEAEVTVTNPGPGDIVRLLVSFTFVGVQGEGDPPVPLVAPAGGRNRAVVSVRPAPAAVAEDGTVYSFGEPGDAFLPAEETRTIVFRLEVPARDGVAANSVTAYDGEDPTRARGALLRTDVGGDA